MENLKVAWILEEIADLLKLKGANYFKIQSYYNVSKRIKNLETNIKKLVANNRLQDIEGIGESLAVTIDEILQTGTCSKYKELKEEIPIGLLEILDLPGVGPKKVKLFYDELGITDLDELKKAAKKQKLRKLSGIGAKTELKILDAIMKAKNRNDKIDLGLATALAEELLDICAKLKSVTKVEVVGGLRRKKELISDLDLLVVTDNSKQVREVMKDVPLVTEVLTETDKSLELASKPGVPIEIFFIVEDEFYSALVAATGNQEHYEALSELAAQKGYCLNNTGVYQLDTNETVEIDSEKEIYQLLDLPYIIPELRTGDHEIEAAREGNLPVKLESADIMGDLHVHTDWSDGGNTIQEMALAARDRGYKFLSICDHSKSLGVAGGLTIDDLKEQIKEIEIINKELTDFRILKGAEVDILHNGDLDYPQEVLDELDMVVASVHSGFRQSGEQMTSRILRALDHEAVNVLGHPTGRLLGKRGPYAVDIEQVIKRAVKTDTVLEINASPHRLDLNGKHLRIAKEAGAKIAINTDAHNIQQLDNMQFGVYNARKGWIEPSEVINTYSLTELLALLYN
ncbi:DNA polymerase/3'-5' exonuclease PolX [Acetohalobium arabaticum]|uniref:DNA-directed DNA polymerase n=1 Tax=Acetohalobium arabaticum (strain ATCC 49924 / DSM 5501 / Z-7288) TaxID=574087 RepID=D9QUN9_ACEAZ|nr:DNA polymerase/3'-5' exonuclease PolX [Acetohalobium arabaticum]ADL11948.1 PHP domain protein [Acetohalobium arabaticum DSM 5501]